jgi:uncharacterized protein (DUF1499 family)
MKQKRNRKVKVGKIMLYGLIGIVVVIVLMALQMFVNNNMAPKNLGVTNGQLAPMPKSPNAASSQSNEEYYKVEPLKMKADLETTKEALLKAVDAYGNGEVKINEDNYIYVVFTTSTMKYKDDLEFYINIEDGLVHYRSASRVGYSDMGLNRERYNAIAKFYNEDE